jgi:hypothetical protein
MWVLHFLPDAFLAFIVNAILIIGVVSTFISFVILNRLLMMFPPLANYYRIAQVVSIIILLAGVYFKGGYSTEMLWRERVAEVEAKLKEAEAKSAEVNTVIETKIVNKVKEIKVQGDEVIKYVDREIVKYDTKFIPGGICEIPKEVISAHNAAALNKPVEGIK